jgi:signal transduction histidine kinase
MKKGLILSTSSSHLFVNSFTHKADRKERAIQYGIKRPVCKILRKVIIVISCLVSLCNASAQNIYTDSIRKKLLLDQVDTSRMLDLAHLGYYLRYINMDSSLYYARSALSLAEQLKYPRGEADVLSILGLIYRDKGELPRALELELKAQQIGEKFDDTVNASCLRRMGIIYYDLKDYRKTIDYCREAYDIDRLIGNYRGQVSDNLVTAMAYIEMKDRDSAWYFIQKSGNYVKDFEADFLWIRGKIYWLKNNKDSAMADWREGLRSGLIMNYFRSVCFIFIEMGTAYRQMKQLDSSIIYAKKGLENAMKASNEKGILLASEMLFELNDSLHKPEALEYLKIATAAKDSLEGAGNITTIQKIIANENARQTEIQTERSSYQSQLRQLMLAMGMGAILIIAIILYRNNRKKQKTNFILARQKAEIQETLAQLKSTQSQLIQSEKMASLGELTAGIAHEIQNPLNFVNNFSQINSELVDEAELAIKKGNSNDAIEVLSNLRNNELKITEHGQRADAIVKSMLQHSRTSSGQKEKVDINALADEYLRLSYQGMRARDRLFEAKITTAFDSNIGKINVIPQDISRVLINLYNNAFYAVREKAKQLPNGYEPYVSVITSKANGKVEIAVKDNGNGIPENIRQKIFQPFFTTKPTGTGTGLGLSLSYDIIKAHGGEIKVETKEGEGSQFVIQLPI